MFGFLKKLSIRNKIVISYFLLVLVPLLFLGTFFYHSYIRILEKNLIKDTAVTNSQVCKSLESKIEEFDRDINSFVFNDSLTESIKNYSLQDSIYPDLEDQRKFENYMTDIFRTRIYAQGIYIVTNNNKIINQQKYGALKSQYITYIKEWRSALYPNNGLTLLNSHIPEILDYSNKLPYVISVLRPLKDYDGLTLGLICIDINVDMIKSIVQDMNYSSESDIVLIDDKGKLVYPVSQTLKAEKKEMFESAISKTAEFKGQASVTSIDNKKYFISYNKSFLTGWKVINIIPYQEMTGGINRVRNVAIIVFASFMLFFFIGSQLFSQYISKPIGLLTRSMKEVNAGNLNVSIEINSEDEVGTLCKSFNNMISSLNSTIKDNYELKIREMDAELSALQSQINPHFLYNTLEMISMVAIVNNDYKVSEMMNMLGSMLRYTIDNKDRIVCLKDEVAYVQNYVNLQKIRCDGKVNFIFNIDSRVMDKKILKLSIQPIIENSLTHGLKYRDGGFIRLDITPENDRLVIVVEDNGTGIARDRLEKILHDLELSNLREYKKYNGVGLANTNTRIKLIFGEDYGIQIQTRKNIGTKITITFPLRD